MRTKMKYLDIRENQIILRFLDNLLVTAGYKSSLEYFGIEENMRVYRSRRANCSCFFIRDETEKDLTYTKVTPIQLQDRN